VLRGLRVANSLSQGQVATRVCCDASLVSMVESGKRVLQPDLARRLDQLYGTGTMITSLAGSLAYPRPPGCATLEGDGDVVLVQLPLRGVTVPVSRRALLAALSMGTTAEALGNARDAMAGVPADEELLAEMTQSLGALHVAGQVLPPGGLIDALTGQVGVLDAVRRRAPRPLRRKYIMLQTQYAENLSWMVQESGDPAGAVYWIDRTQQWADQARWPAMTAYAHVRRSMVASTCAGDGLAAVEHAANARRVPRAPARIRGLAAKQMAYGYALDNDPDGSNRALEEAVRLLEVPSDQGPHGGSDPVATSRIDVGSALAQYRATCDVYLGGGERAVPLLDSVRTGTSLASRGGAVNAARLARAYAQAGDPDQACAAALEALGTGKVVDSLSTRVELRRALKPLDRWPGREDVAEVRHRIGALA
jgi:transcriptional regulator with XRE-family HTH domain